MNADKGWATDEEFTRQQHLFHFACCRIWPDNQWVERQLLPNNTHKLECTLKPPHRNIWPLLYALLTYFTQQTGNYYPPLVISTTKHLLISIVFRLNAINLVEGIIELLQIGVTLQIVPHQVIRKGIKLWTWISLLRSRCWTSHMDHSSVQIECKKMYKCFFCLRTTIIIIRIKINENWIICLKKWNCRGIIWLGYCSHMIAVAVDDDETWC